MVTERMQTPSAGPRPYRFARSGDATQGDIVRTKPIGAFHGRTVRARNFTLYARTAGEGPPAVLVHGLGGSSTNWTDLMGLLAPDLACTALDLPGFGRSAPSPGGRYDLDTHVAAVRALLESLGEPAHLFGNSTGGAIVTRLAAERPDLVRSLVLVSPALPVHRPRRGVDSRLGLLLIPGVDKMVLRRIRATPPEERVRQMLELCYADLDRVEPERWDEAVEEAARRADLPWALPAFSGTLRGLIRGWFEPGSRNLWAQAARVERPVLVVTGDRDRLVPQVVAHRAFRTFPDCELVVLPGVGHVAQMETPEDVAAVTRTFLAGVPA
jgi:pimeloyl-ACP methyl ester carboxylesterase